MTHRGVNTTAAFRALFPHIPEDGLEEAEAAFECYVKATLRIYERLRQDPIAWKHFLALTQLAAELYDGADESN
jgi:hypothetical protein